MNSHDLAKKLLEMPNLPTYSFNGQDFNEIVDLQLMDAKDLPTEDDQNITEKQLEIPTKLICLI